MRLEILFETLFISFIIVDYSKKQTSTFSKYSSNRGTMGRGTMGRGTMGRAVGAPWVTIFSPISMTYYKNSKRYIE